MKMDRRKKQVLMAIIQDYIETAEPVGSRTIARKYKLGVSPATIRNEMADLEELGYIKQPYTSAGRIPEDMGYRYYVDYLMKPVDLSREEMELIHKDYYSKVNNVAEVIQKTGQLLSQLTNYTALVLTPQIRYSSLKHIQLVMLRPHQAMLVAIMDTGAIKNWLIEVPENINSNDLAKISQVLNAKLQGQTMESIKLNLLQEAYQELSKHKKLLDIAFGLLDQGLDEKTGGKVYMGGIINILNQPEFHNVDKVKTLLSLLEQDDILYKMLVFGNHDEDVSVRIGREFNKIDECSIVTATYKVGSIPVGSIGILGPTRMKYERVISVVEYTTKYMSRVLERFFENS